MCTKPEKGEEVPILMETKSEEAGFSFEPVDTIKLYLADSFSDMTLFPSLTFSGSTDAEANTAELNEIHITAPYLGEDGQDTCTNWPLLCFKSIEIFAPKMEVIESGYGTLKYSLNAWSAYRCPKLKSSIKLAMKPAEELLKTESAKSLGIVYQLFYENGDKIFTDVRPWE